MGEGRRGSDQGETDICNSTCLSEYLDLCQATHQFPASGLSHQEVKLKHTGTHSLLSNMKRSIFHWGELGSRFRGSKPNKVRKLIQATPWEELADNEEIDHICCSPHLTVFVLRDGRVYTRSNSHKRSGQLELITAIQDEKIHTADIGGSNILYVSEAGNVYISKVPNQKCGVANKSFIVTKPKLLTSFVGRCVVQVACGSNHSLALCKDGQVFAWGKNTNGQLGVGEAVGTTHSPQHVTALAGIPLAQITAGGSHTIAVSLSGTVFAWGANHRGQLGLNDVKARYHPTCVKLLECKKVVQVSCGAHHTAVLNKDGLVYTFGAGTYGQLGHNSDRDELKPRLLEGLDGIKVSQIACGSSHTMVFSSASGQLYSFGRGENGQLGTGQTIDHFVPCLVTFSTDGTHNLQPAPGGLLQPAVKRIFAGANQSVALCFGVKASHSADYQSSFNPLRRIVMAEDSFWNTWSILDNGELQKDIKEEIGHIFSAECLNGSFLEVSGDEHFKTGRETSGVDLSAASLWFEKLGKHPILLQEVTTTVEEILIPSLTKSPAGVEALRVYLVLPELIDIQMEENNSVKLAGLLSAAMVALEESQLQILESWWSSLNEFFFNKLVNLFRSASHFLLQGTSSKQETFPKELHSCLSILQRLFRVNSTRKPKYQENKFYICAQEVFGDTGVYCKALLELIPYPCIFNMETKILIFTIICQLSISNKNITDYGIILGNINSTHASALVINVSAGLEMDAYTENIVASAGDTVTSTGIIEASAGDTVTSTGIIEASAGDINTSTGIIEASAEDTDTSTGIIEASAGDTDTSTGIIEASAGDTDTSTGIVEASAGDTDAFTGIIEASAGDANTSTGIVEASAEDADTSTGIIEASAGDTDTSTGIIEASAGDTDTSTGIIEASAGDTDTSTGIIEASAGDTDAFTGIIEASAGDTDPFTGIIEASAGDANTSTGIVEASAEDTDMSTGIVEVSNENTEIPTRDIEASTGNPNASAGIIDLSAGNTEASNSILDASSANIEVSMQNSTFTDIDHSLEFDISTSAIDEPIGIVDAPQKNTDGPTQINDVLTASTETSTGNIEISTGMIEMSAGDNGSTETLTGNTETCARVNDVPSGNSETSTEIPTGIIEISTGISDSLTEIIEASAGDNGSTVTLTGNTEACAANIETSTGNTEASTGMIEISTRNPEPLTEIIATSARTIETSTGNTNDSNGIVPAPALSLELSSGIDMNSPDVNFEFDSTAEEDDCEDNTYYFDYEDIDIDFFYLEMRAAMNRILNIGSCFLLINRTEILQNTLTQLRSYQTTALRGYFQVIFIGEEAVDEGGVSREFFTVIATEFCSRPKILKQYDESRLVWFPEWEPEINDVFRLLGIICWLALYNGYVADFHFPLALYKKLLNEQPTLDDLKELSPTVGRNLQELLNYEGDDLEEIFCMDFTIGADMADGSITRHELIPNGKNIPVQSHNRKLFVDKYVDYIFNTSVEKHFQAFSEGFRYVPLPVVDLFLPDELMALLQGNMLYDWPQLEENASYRSGYTRTDEAIVQFWQMFHELTQEEKKHFLAFLTGCDKVPIGGMGKFRIVIRQDFRLDPDLYFPTAHTCYQMLDLPRYSSAEILRERFLRAIGCSRGFGIA
ncbi:probable E3 ubiquitin-protein ligase HERC4 [Leucoraja erinacea]|uniref:probable E3 ubiquitin-protein ligase HERC4 n=1 Tax=Leucoraja erinaceus TaxID=7782 RepID=UPI00245873B1|nr:probable E3 ubiquitin-protein ligase HERC4 [Leucoraja erinacea]